MATIITEPGVLQEVLWHERPLRAGELDIDGDRQAGEQFLTLFPIPS